MIALVRAIGSRSLMASSGPVKTQTMADRVERRFDLRPQKLAGDTVYGAATLLKWLIDRDVTQHVPVWDKSERPRAGVVDLDSECYVRTG